jgi:hypothetical protein
VKLTAPQEQKENNMRGIKTRKAYGEHSNGNTYYLGDTVDAALKANMMVRDYEKELVKLNPQLKITFKVEEK